MITGSTLYKQLLFKTDQQLDLLQTSLFELVLKYQWRLEAWAIFPNHYHLIVQSPTDPKTLRRFLTHLHANTARELNRLDHTPGRTVWYQYWDTHLTFKESYFPRLKYVMHNPVKHKIVTKAEDYEWCSVRWFEKNAPASHRKVVSSFKIDALNVMDDF